VAPIPLLSPPDLCFVGLAGDTRLQNINSRDFVNKFSGMNDLRDFKDKKRIHAGITERKAAAKQKPRHRRGFLSELYISILPN
jgi:hypothetical protein